MIDSTDDTDKLDSLIVAIIPNYHFQTFGCTIYIHKSVTPEDQSVVVSECLGNNHCVINQQLELAYSRQRC